MEMLDSIFSTRMTRGRMQYFMSSAGVLLAAGASVMAGAFVISLELGGLGGVVAAAFFFIAFIFLLGSGWILASRIRDVGWNVPMFISVYYGMTITAIILNFNATPGDNLPLIVSLAQFIFGLVIQFTPGKEA